MENTENERRIKLNKHTVNANQTKVQDYKFNLFSPQCYFHVDVEKKRENLYYYRQTYNTICKNL